MIGGILLSFLLGILLCLTFSDKAPEKVYIEVEKNISVPCKEHNDTPLIQHIFREKEPPKETTQLQKQDELKKEEISVEEVGEGEYILASGTESYGEYKISLISTIPKEKIIDPKSDYFPLPITIHGKIGEERKFILNTVTDISKYANDIKLKITRIEKFTSQEIMADFLYGVTVPGDYEMEISIEPLSVLYFNLKVEKKKEIFKKPTKELSKKMLILHK